MQRFTGPPWTWLDLELVEAGGIEPPSESPDRRVTGRQRVLRRREITFHSARLNYRLLWIVTCSWHKTGTFILERINDGWRGYLRPPFPRAARNRQNAAISFLFYEEAHSAVLTEK